MSSLLAVAETIGSNAQIRATHTSETDVAERKKTSPV